MVHIESDHCKVSCGYEGTTKEITVDCMAIALTMYGQLLELDAEAAEDYVDLMREFANDPAGTLDKYSEEEPNE